MDDSQHNDDSRPAVPAGEYYASSAFDSRHIPDLDPAVYEQDSHLWPPQSLPWERRPDPAKLRRCIAFGVEGVAPEKSANMMCDGRLLRFVMPSTRLHPVFLFMAQLCGAFLIGIVIYYACGGLHLNWLWLLGGLLLLATLGSLLLHTDLVLTFDRKTGLVSEGEGEPTPQNTVLFYECDPYIVSVQRKKGSPVLYRLGFRPRTMARLPEPWIVHQADNPEDIYVMWHFIQMYMDTARPLPDIPALELYRSQDPRTQKYDQRHHRDPEYWGWKAPEERAMLYEKALNRFPSPEPVWPCIMAMRIPGRNPEEPIRVRPA